MTTEKNDALIAEMLRDAQPAQVESDLTKNPVIHKGDGDMPAPMTVKEVSNAGYVWIYNTKTGERIPCLSYMLTSKLRIRRKDGSGAYMFTTNDPKVRATMGSIKCMLHPQAENREAYNSLGFRVCNKENLTNNYQLEQHMKKKHPQEWAAISAEKAKIEKEEDRKLQRLLLQQAAGVIVNKAVVIPEPLPVESTEPEVYISNKDRAKMEAKGKTK